ncbi:MAG: hypothetical protein R3B82_29725 [Sandaracinaceae bacterium]
MGEKDQRPGNTDTPYEIVGPSRVIDRDVRVFVREKIVKRTLTPRSPETTAHDLTGFWVTVEKRGATTSGTLKVNQAGYYLALWFSKRGSTHVEYLSGERATDGVYQLFERGKTHAPAGRLVVRGDDALVLEPTMGTTPLPAMRFQRWDREATMSSHVIDSLPSELTLQREAPGKAGKRHAPSIRDLVRRDEHRPLDPRDIERVRAMMLRERKTSKKLAGCSVYIDRFFANAADGTPPSAAERAAHLVDLDRYIRRIFELGPPKHLPEEDRMRLADFGRLVVGVTAHEVAGEKRSMESWIQTMVNGSRVLSAAPAPAIAKYLEIEPDNATHYYFVTLGQVSPVDLHTLVTKPKSISIKPGIGGALVVGELRVEKLDRPLASDGSRQPGTVPIFDETYDASFLGYGQRERGLRRWASGRREFVDAGRVGARTSSAPPSSSTSVGAGKSVGISGLVLEGEQAEPLRPLVIDVSRISDLFRRVGGHL